MSLEVERSYAARPPFFGFVVRYGKQGQQRAVGSLLLAFHSPLPSRGCAKCGNRAAISKGGGRRWKTCGWFSTVVHDPSFPQPFLTPSSSAENSRTTSAWLLASAARLPYHCWLRPAPAIG